MLNKKHFLVLVLFLSLSINRARGAFLTLPQLDTTQTDAIFRTLAADFTFRPVEPASSFGKTWGFSFGILGEVASAGALSSIIGTGTPVLPNAGIFAALQGPYGIALEAGFLPTLTLFGGTIGNFGLNGKWTLTEVFLAGFPVNIAIRAMLSTASLSSTQPLAGGTVTVAYSGTTYGFNVGVSKKFGIVEPYIGYGFVQHSSSIAGTGSVSLFNASFPAGTTSASGSGGSGWFHGGIQFGFGLFNLGLEYDSLFAVDTGLVKLGFRF